MRSFLDSVFNLAESFNIRIEAAFLCHKVELVKGKVSLDAMQSFAVRFAAAIDDWIPRFPYPHDRSLNERLVGYFYKGIEPEPLRMLVSHFRVDRVYDVFDQFKLQCMASVVEMVNLKTEESFRDRQFRSRQQQQIPEPSRPLGGERRATENGFSGNQNCCSFGGISASNFLLRKLWRDPRITSPSDLMISHPVSLS